MVRWPPDAHMKPIRRRAEWAEGTSDLRAAQPAAAASCATTRAPAHAVLVDLLLGLVVLGVARPPGGTALQRLRAPIVEGGCTEAGCTGGTRAVRRFVGHSELRPRLPRWTDGLTSVCCESSPVGCILKSPVRS